MPKRIFEGVCTALATPFTADGSAVDFDAFGRLISRQLSAGVDALCVCGTTGESSTLSPQEQQALIRFCVKEAGGTVPVIAGAGSNSTSAALEACLRAQDSGADALLIVTPYYNKTSQKGLLEHYTYLADRVDRPIILYHVPSRTGLSFQPETYAALSAHPNIAGVKEASGNLNLQQHTAQAACEGFTIWSGNDDQVLPAMALGAAGAISALSNLAPSAMVHLTHACLDGDFAAARAVQQQLLPLMDALFCQVNPIPLKYALSLVGIGSGALRMPLAPLEESLRPQIASAMEQAGVFSSDI